MWRPLEAEVEVVLLLELLMVEEVLMNPFEQLEHLDEYSMLMALAGFGS